MYRVYVSAPITAATPEEELVNVEYAMAIGHCLAELGIAVYVPHTTWYMDQAAMTHERTPMCYGYLEQDYEWIKQCGLILRLPDPPFRKSKGCELEEKKANNLFVPCWFSVKALVQNLSSDDTPEGRSICSNFIRIWGQGEEAYTDLENYAKSLLVERDARLAELQSHQEPDKPKPNECYGHPRFYELLKQMADLHNCKNHDYAGSEDPLRNLRRCEKIGLPAWKGVLVRLQDKWERLENFAQGGTLKVENESAVDTLMDNAVYSLLCIILMEGKEERGESPVATACRALQSYGVYSEEWTFLNTSSHCPVEQKGEKSD